MSVLAILHRRSISVATIILLAAGPVSAAQVFLSPSDVTPNPAAESWQNMPVGATASLFVWVIPDEGDVIDGISLSLQSTSAGVIEADLAAFPDTHTVFNPAITGGEVRWDGVTVQDPQTLIPPPPPETPGGVLNEGDLLFRDWNAAAVIPVTPIPGFTPNHGIDAAGAANDTLWDAASGAFLHSRLEIMALATGTTDLFLKVGEQGITAHALGFDTIQFGPGGGLTDGGVAGATDPQREGLFSVVALAGDTNGDGRVDIDDLNNVRNNFGDMGLGDTDGNGAVDIDDLNAVRNNFGSFSAPMLVPVPEPRSLQILTTTLAVFAFFGWRGPRRLLESGK